MKHLEALIVLAVNLIHLLRSNTLMDNALCIAEKANS